MTVCQNDLKVGGAFRHVWRATPAASRVAMRGVYREVVPPSAWCAPESFEFGCVPQAGEQIVTMVLSETKGKTTLTTHHLVPSKEARDGMIASAWSVARARATIAWKDSWPPRRSEQARSALSGVGPRRRLHERSSTPTHQGALRRRALIAPIDRKEKLAVASTGSPGRLRLSSRGGKVTAICVARSSRELKRTLSG